MRWTDRQRQMLDAMGLRLWGAASPASAAAVPEVAPAVPQVPRRAPVPAPEPAATPAPVTATATPTPTPTPPAAAPAPLATPVRLPAVVTPSCAGLDWPALRQAVAECRACSLCESRTQTVFGVGHASAHWMIVGEAPGEQEDQQGEPFVGAAGQLLDQMLRAVGLTRADDDAARQVYIANTLKCRPPRNRNPEPDELAQCAPFLQRQIDLVQPRIILAMGRFAVKTLLQSDEPIGKLRGRVHRLEGRPVIVTYHPAYLLRNLPDKARAWDDLCLAAATVAA